MRVPTYLALSYLMASSVVSHADEATFSGSVEVEARLFLESPALPDQLSGTQFSVALDPEWHWETSDRRWSFRFLPFARIDGEDDARTHLDIREASLEYFGDDWDGLIGVSSVFWGVTEARHLVNVINQVDVLEGTDEETFLGQPMIRLGTQRDWGRLDLYLLSGFRERSVKSETARLRPLLTVDDDATFEGSNEHSGVDIAARYSHVFGDWDFALSAFHGTSREPILIPVESGSTLRPFYGRVSQAGLEAQYTSGPWLWKLEAIAKEDRADTYGAAVGGFEYSLFQAFSSDADIGFIAEYLFDGRSLDAPPTPFDDDIFLGTRVALNDTQDSTLLLGAIADLNNGSTSFRMEAQRRLGLNMLIELEAQLFDRIDTGDPLLAFERDSFLTLRLSRYF